MKKVFLIIGFILLLFIDCVLLQINRGLRKSLNLLQYSYEVLNNQNSLKERIYYENILQYTINYGKKVNENLELLSEDGQLIKLKEIAAKRPVIIFRYFAESCHSCIESEFRIMKEVFSTEELKRIVILTTEKEPSKINLIKRMNQINNPVYIIKNEDTGLPVEKTSGPYLFVIDNSFYIENLFIPLKLNSSPSIEYYKLIKRLYFDQTK